MQKQKSKGIPNKKICSRKNDLETYSEKGGRNVF